MHEFIKEFRQFKKTVRFDDEIIKKYLDDEKQIKAFYDAIYVLRIIDDAPKKIVGHIQNSLDRTSIETEELILKLKTEKEKNILFSNYEKMLHLSYLETIFNFFKMVCEKETNG